MTSESSKNIPIDFGQNIPLAQLGQCVAKCGRQRRYTKAREIETLALSKYRGSGKGITYKDLLSSGHVSNKKQGQITLKHCLSSKVLFTIGNHKPQRYYPGCLKSEILKKNIPVGATGVLQEWSFTEQAHCKFPRSRSCHSPNTRKLRHSSAT